MKAAGARLGERLADTEIRDAAHPLPERRGLRTSTAHPTTSARLLVRQLSSPVRWTATVAALGGGGMRGRSSNAARARCSPASSSASRGGGETQIFALEDPETSAAAIPRPAA